MATELMKATLTGLPGGSKSYYLAELLSRERKSLVVVTKEDFEAEGLSADLEALVVLSPAAERSEVIYLSEMDEAMRIAALDRWSQAKRAILLTSSASLDKPVFSPAQLKAKTLDLVPGQSYPRSKLLEKFAQGGYSRT